MKLSIDPGLHTGIARNVNGVYSTTCLVGEFENHTQILVWRYIIDNHLALKQGYVVIERFATAGVLSKYGLETIHIVGGTLALCQAFNIKVHIHIPQNRYAFQKQAKEMLKKTKHVIHEEDALAHLLAREYLESKK